MRRIILPAAFFNRDTLLVARDLLGKYLIRQNGDGCIASMITEVEAYDGPGDRACHASKGLTARTATLFGAPGRWYVYFTYGMHWLLNVVAGPEGYPAGILIRGIAGTNGPARITKALKIDGSFNGKKAGRSSGLWVEDRGIVVRPKEIRRLPRIGVAYAGAWANKPYRFVWDLPEEASME